MNNQDKTQKQDLKTKKYKNKDHSRRKRLLPLSSQSKISNVSNPQRNRPEMAIKMANSMRLTAYKPMMTS
jgi:hypothetical protein